VILLTGATGYVGRHLLQSLTARGVPVRCLLLPDDAAAPAGPGLEVVRADLLDAAALAPFGAGVSAVVHAAALMLPNPAERIRAVNVDGTRNLLAAARGWGAPRFVYLSAVSAVYAEKNSYGLSKAEAERLVVESGLDYTILRPTLVYGPEGGLHFAQLVRLLRRIPLVTPILGGGGARLQPVFVGDVVDAIERALGNPHASRRIYNVSGATVVRFDELCRRICAVLGLRRVQLRIPMGLVRAAAAVAARLPGSFLTPESLSGLSQDATLDHSGFAAECGYAPLDIDAGLRRALGRG
jgi:NADH dehydrogenase